MTGQTREARLHELVGRIYEAALDASHWRSVVQEIGDVFGGASGLVINDTAGHPRIAEAANFDPVFVGSYDAYYGRTNPWLTEFAKLPSGRLLHRGLAPAIKLEATEYYNDWLRPQGLRDAVGGILVKVGQHFSYVGVIRRVRLGDFTDSDRRAFRVVLDNMVRALSVSAKLAQVTAHEATLFDALGRTGLGAFVVSEGCRLLSHNNIAHELLKDGASLRVRHGSLAARHPSVTSQLAHAVTTVCHTCEGHSLILPRTGSDGRSLVAFVMPTRSGEHTDPLLLASTSPRCALILVKVPAQLPQSNTGILRELFGLTGAEARLMEELASGRSLEEISQVRNVCYGTLRAQLRTVMAKTDTRRQGELIALAARYTALNISDPSLVSTRDFKAP